MKFSYAYLLNWAAKPKKKKDPNLSGLPVEWATGWDDPRAYIKDFDAITNDIWQKVSDLMVGLGYDIRGAEDAKERVRLQLERKRKNGAPMSISGDLGRSIVQAYGLEPEDKIETFTPTWDDEEVVNTFGETDDWSVVGYILTDGRQISLGGPSGGRAYDHRNIGDVNESMPGGNRGMQEFMAAGNIRVIPESPGLDIMLEPTPEQYRAINDFLDWFSDRMITVDLQSGLGRFDESTGFYGSKNRKSLTYDPGTSPVRIINDIRKYYGG